MQKKPLGSKKSKKKEPIRQKTPKKEKRTNKTHHFLAYEDPKCIYNMLGLVFRHKIIIIIKKKGFFLNFRALTIIFS